MDLSHTPDPEKGAGRERIANSQTENAEDWIGPHDFGNAQNWPVHKKASPTAFVTSFC